MSEIVRQVPFPFSGGRFPSELGAVVQRTVVDGELPALIVIHDDDGDWLIGDDVTDASDPAASVISHVRHLVDRDPSIEETAGLSCGYAARRSSRSAPWAIEKWSYVDEDA
ncbi:hypothetical protein [Streptosporangium sp. NPDC000396]|uniref:hypothetical protein n=1 Tax=Streptosporangium sp. NPDC000396 TaxID=3366185 RepID=UPI00368FB878